MAQGTQPASAGLSIASIIIVAALLVSCRGTSGGPDSQPPNALARPAFAPPQAAAFPSNPLGPEMILAVQTTSVTSDVSYTGLSYSYWHESIIGGPVNGGWTRWQHNPNHTGVLPDQYWDEELPLVGWIDEGGHTRANGFFYFRDPANAPRIAAPYWDVHDFGYRFDIHDPVSNSSGSDFAPITGVAWRDPGHDRLNFYGYVTDPNRPPFLNTIREYWWDGSSWGWSDLGRPNDDVKRMELGPQSALVTQGGNVHESFVFVVGDDTGTPVDSRLWLLYHNNNESPDWEWLDLDRPDDVSYLRTPVAFKHIDASSGVTKVSVFVVGVSRFGQYRLYERHWPGGDWDDWEDWQEWGDPPGYFESGNDALSGAGNSAFDMTSAVVWDDNGTKRINIFGYTDVERNTAGIPIDEGGYLVEFYWDGANWNWGQTMPTPERIDAVFSGTTVGRAPVPFQTTSSVVFDSPTRDRISVFGKSASGLVWERYWDTAEGQQWIWLQH